MFKLLFFIFLFTVALLFSCSEKHYNQKPIICEKDTILEDIDSPNKGPKVGQIHIDEPTELIKKKRIDSIAKVEEAFRLAMLDKQQVTEFKETIYSKSIDLNFDKKKDLIIIYIIVTGKDTITYFSFYSHLEGEMKNTFDYRFDDKIDKIYDIRTFNDSTFVISAVLTNQKKSIHKKFKYINDNTFHLLN